MYCMAMLILYPYSAPDSPLVGPFHSTLHYYTTLHYTVHYTDTIVLMKKIFFVIL